MQKYSFRVRFAPSPTGFMHLGNVRAALLNYLFAKQHKGAFVLRIEDTDDKRNTLQAMQQITNDLMWLGLSCDEGPGTEGKYAPYLQSERHSLYQQKLHELIEHGKTYRCFCKPEALEQKRALQLAAGKPPRYDRTCKTLPNDLIKHKIDTQTPFVWRFELDDAKTVEINDMARGTVSFELCHFSDPVIARNDGSFMFIFANFVDDWLMNITHVIRGEDHLSNTALQAALYDTFNVDLPTFWHLPMICNQSGQKLSKRDFGFSLSDLQGAGFLPEAICSYLASLGISTNNELQSLPELVSSYNFKHVPSGGTIKYDPDKLRWTNHQWIAKLSLDDLYERVKPLLQAAYQEAISHHSTNMKRVLTLIRPELRTLQDVVNVCRFYFEEPQPDIAKLENEIGSASALQATKLIKAHLASLDHDAKTFIEVLKRAANEEKLSTKALFVTLRYLLTGNLHGIGINDLVSILDASTIKNRLDNNLI